MMAESDDARTARIVALPGMSTKADLVQIQKELCPAVPYWDPLQLADQTFWSEPNEATIGFLRQAEIKHGRVAMAGFVGFCVHANGYRWPAAMTLDGQPFPDIKECSSPVELWDKIPEAAKWQIILFVGALEWYDEYQFESDEGKPKHYMRGGIPGKYPAFGGLPLNLYDPFKLFKKMTEEEKARGRLKEINNGRLAMIGMMSFVAEAKVPGSVPSLKGLVGEYKGNIMVPFETDFSLFGDTAAKIATMPPLN
jgi:hypothetical protein